MKNVLKYFLKYFMFLQMEFLELINYLADICRSGQGTMVVDFFFRKRALENLKEKNNFLSDGRIFGTRAA
jgi:hypothetical protein